MGRAKKEIFMYVKELAPLSLLKHVGDLLQPPCWFMCLLAYIMYFEIDGNDKIFKFTGKLKGRGGGEFHIHLYML